MNRNKITIKGISENKYLSKKDHKRGCVVTAINLLFCSDWLFHGSPHTGKRDWRIKIGKL